MHVSLRDVPTDTLSNGWRDFMLERNRSEGLVDAIRQFAKLHYGVKKNDRLTYTYVPGAGVTLRRNDRVVGTVRGVGFAHFLFSILVGPGADSSLRAGYLSAGR